MKKNLSCVLLTRTIVAALLCVLVTTHVQSQTWAFRNGWGTTELGSERASALCVDASGNVYMTGTYTGSVNFGTGALPFAVGADGFVAKFNAAGVCQWAMRFGDNVGFLDQGQGICTDGTSVYVTGTFNTNMTVGTSPTVYNANGGGSSEGLVIKLAASNGATQWVTTFGGTAGESSQAICLDGTGNVYISGLFFAGSATFGSFSRTPNGSSSSDLFVARLNPGDGTFNWVSTGGSLADTDNPNGSSICYVPGLNEIIVGGSYVDAAATYSTTSPVSSVSLPMPAGNENEMMLLEVNATNGAFISGINIAGAEDEEIHGLAYDPFTQDVVLTGYFSSSSITFPGNAALTNNKTEPAGTGEDDIFYARYNPTTNAFPWSKSGGGDAGTDRGLAICSNTTGGVLIAGRYRGVVTFPGDAGNLSLTSTRASNADDIFIARIDVNDGNVQLLAKGAGTMDNNITNQANAIATGPTGGGSVWVAGSYATPVTFAPLAALAVSGPATADIFLAKFNDPLPLDATTSSTPVSCNNGCNGTATATPSGGVTPYTYSWAPSGGTAATATGLCPNNYTVTITDAINNVITRNVTISPPVLTLATATTSNGAYPVSAANTNIADAACKLIATLVPNGANPVNGNVSANVWVEPSVPVYPAGGKPFVARHYQLTPATSPGTATGRVTLYFLQSEFDAFNNHAGSTLNLPGNSGDNGGKMNLRIGKYPGNSSGGGLPGSYTGQATVINPLEADIVFNGTTGRWEVSFDVTNGFSGFIVQTSTAVLPVTWLQVIGSLDRQSRPGFTWQVQEQQVASYEVEKSTDGAGFAGIGQIASQGDGTHTYQFRENTSLQGTASYRIKQTDKDGRISYSKIIILKNTQGGSVTVYPNPATRWVTLNITDRELMNSTARLYDLHGKELQQIRIRQTVTTIDLGQYGTGTYIVRLQNGTTIKLLKE